MMNKSFILILVFILTSCTAVENTKTQEKTNLDYLTLKGINLKQIGKYSEALKYYEKVLISRPEDILVLKEMGETYSKLENFSEGILYYKKVLEIDSKDKDALRNLAYIYYLKKDYEVSIFYLEQIYDRELDLESKKLKSYLYFKTNNLEKSLSFSKKIEDLINIFDKIYYGAYNSFLEENYPSKSKVFLERLKNKYYEDINAINFYFENIIKVDDNYSVYEKEIKRYIVTHSKNDSLYLNLVEILLKQKNYKEAQVILKFVSPKSRTEEKYQRLNNWLKNI